MSNLHPTEVQQEILKKLNSRLRMLIPKNSVQPEDPTYLIVTKVLEILNKYHYDTFTEIVWWKDSNEELLISFHKSFGCMKQQVLALIKDHNVPLWGNKYPVKHLINAKQDHLLSTIRNIIKVDQYVTYMYLVGIDFKSKNSK